MPQTTGYATRFADPQDLVKYQNAIAQGKTEQQALAIGDNGIGALPLGKIQTTGTYGVAVPTSYLQQNFGSDPANWRTARAQVTFGDQTIQVPIVDVGPGKKQQKSGVITDLTNPLAQALGTGDKAKVSLNLVPNAGPDYLADRDSFNVEQNRIGNQLMAQARGPMVSDTSDVGSQQNQMFLDAIRKSQIGAQLTQPTQIS